MLTMSMIMLMTSMLMSMMAMSPTTPTSTEMMVKMTQMTQVLLGMKINVMTVMQTMQLQQRQIAKNMLQKVISISIESQKKFFKFLITNNWATYLMVQATVVCTTSAYWSKKPKNG